ncbi:hypothetical protein FOXYSP1_04526 [Fusarium oxysporum f. sp. phaseoli]
MAYAKLTQLPTHLRAWYEVATVTRKLSAISHISLSHKSETLIRMRQPSRWQQGLAHSADTT